MRQVLSSKVGAAVALIMLLGCSAPGDVFVFSKYEPSRQTHGNNAALAIETEGIRLRGKAGDFRDNAGDYVFFWQAMDGAQLDPNSSVVFVWGREAEILVGKSVVPQLGFKRGVVSGQAQDLLRAQCEKLHYGPSGKGETLERCLLKRLGEEPLKGHSAQVGFSARTAGFERRGERITLSVPLVDLVGDPLAYRVSLEQSPSGLVLRLYTGKDPPKPYRLAESRHVYPSWPLRGDPFEIPPPRMVVQVNPDDPTFPQPSAAAPPR
jgi:hypothetical protein